LQVLQTLRRHEMRGSVRENAKHVAYPTGNAARRRTKTKSEMMDCTYGGEISMK
jgi:hypothetical protein